MVSMRKYKAIRNEDLKASLNLRDKTAAGSPAASEKPFDVNRDADESVAIAGHRNNVPNFPGGPEVNAG